MEFRTGSLISFLLAVSFAAGLNLYATMAALGLLARMGVAPLPAGLEFLGNTWVIAVAAALFAVEFVADKIPAFDLVWNAAHTFIRVPAAALLAFRASQHLSPGMQLLVTAVGAAVAGVAHTSKTAVRVAATASPEPVSNAVLSTTEDAAALGLTWMASRHPVASMITAGVLMAGLGFIAWRCVRLVRSGWAKLRARFRRPGAELARR